MTSPVICHICKTENEPEAPICKKCGARLAPVKTIPLEGDPPTQKTRDRLIPDIPTTPGTISLYIPVEREPVSVQAKEKLVIGRYFKGAVFEDDPKPDIDLAQYDAHLLGVSRIHAMITLDENGYNLEDLNSRNGTWVNARRLDPHKPQRLSSGDLIRLGHFLMFIYFGVAQSAQVSTTLRLVERGQLAEFIIHRGATLGYITRSVLPLLKAIVDLQRFINEITKRVAADPNIQSIDFFTGEDHQVEVRVDGIAEAIRYIETHVVPWKAKYIHTPGEVPAVLHPFEGSSTNGQDKSGDKMTTQLLKMPRPTYTPKKPNAVTTSPLQPPVDAPPDELIETFKKMVRQIIEEFAPEHQQVETSLLPRISPHVYAIIASTLDIK